MDLKQNETISENDTSTEGVADVSLTPKQDYYITFCASAGLSVDADGDLKTMSMERFANKIGVARATLYRWKDTIPDFETKVSQRRRQIFAKNRENIIWKGLFLKAAAGDVKAAEMVLSHFSDYVPPTQKHEVKIGGLVDLAKQARAKNERRVVDADITT